MNIGTPPRDLTREGAHEGPLRRETAPGPLTGLAHLTGGGLPSALAARLMSHPQTEQA
jgi:hypothetical protein